MDSVGRVQIFKVNTFTDFRFGGNQAAVCLLESDVSDKMKMQITAEINTPECAYVVPVPNKVFAVVQDQKEKQINAGNKKVNKKVMDEVQDYLKRGYSLIAKYDFILRGNKGNRGSKIVPSAEPFDKSKTARETEEEVSRALKELFKKTNRFKLTWFTQEAEVQLCGNGTLAAAIVLFQKCGNYTPTLEFETRHSGVLFASSADLVPSVCCNMQKHVQISLPPRPPSTLIDENANLPLWKIVKEILQDDFQYLEELRYSPSVGYHVAVMRDGYTREQLEALKPTSGPILAIEQDPNEPEMQAVIVTARKSGIYDFISRYFCPWYGVLEHSVTGSAHAVLGPYWSPIVGKTDMFARQCSKRGGELRVKVFDNEVGMCGQGPVIVDGTIEV